jgi:hypothetical protein
VAPDLKSKIRARLFTVPSGRSEGKIVTFARRFAEWLGPSTIHLVWSCKGTCGFSRVCVRYGGDATKSRVYPIVMEPLVIVSTFPMLDIAKGMIPLKLSLTLFRRGP